MYYIKNDIKFIIIFIIIGFLVGPKIFANQKEIIPIGSDDQTIKTQAAVQKTPKENPFDNIKITGKSAYVWDIANQRVIFSKDSDTKRPLASITKMMTAIVAIESSNKNNSIIIDREDLDTEGDNGLREGEKWSLGELLALTLVTSSNDGAAAIAASVGASQSNVVNNKETNASTFVSKMNERAKELELNSLYFNTPTGLDMGNTPGGVGNARDVAKLFEYTLRRHSDFLQYTSLAKISVQSKQNIVHKVSNTNEIASITPGIIGGKTGFTDLAGGNLAVVVDIGIQHPIAIVVLGSTREDRFTDVTKLLNATKKLNTD